MGAALPAHADETRALDAHVHGSGALNIAVAGNQIALELEVPGFDIVGFEYAATSEADKAAIAAALETLGDPSKIFAFPATAGCAVTNVAVDLHGDGAGHADAHGHDAGDEPHGAEAEDKDHDHDDHGDEAHADHAHDHDHEEAAKASHSEFHAEYLMTCSDVTAVTGIDLSYFSLFENAEELEVQVVTAKGAAVFEATPDAPQLDLSQAM